MLSGDMIDDLGEIKGIGLWLTGWASFQEAWATLRSDFFFLFFRRYGTSQMPTEVQNDRNETARATLLAALRRGWSTELAPDDQPQNSE